MSEKRDLSKSTADLFAFASEEKVSICFSRPSDFRCFCPDFTYPVPAHGKDKKGIAARRLQVDL